MHSPSYTGEVGIISTVHVCHFFQLRNLAAPPCVRTLYVTTCMISVAFEKILLVGKQLHWSEVLDILNGGNPKNGAVRLVVGNAH